MRNNQSSTLDIYIYIFQKCALSRHMSVDIAQYLEQDKSMLLRNLHKTHPPAFGLAKHDHFDEWKPVTHEALMVCVVASSAGILK